MCVCVCRLVDFRGKCAFVRKATRRLRGIKKMPVSFFPSAGQAEEKPPTGAKKRRRKQNDGIGELGELLPFQGIGGKDLDKLSILRLTASYIRFQNFMTMAYGEDGAHKQSVLTNLIDQAMDGFLMVIASDGGILYASDNMESFVGLNPRDVIGHSVHDLVQSQQDNDTITENLQPKGNQLNQHRMFYIRLRNSVTPGQVKVSRYNTNLSLQLNGHLKVFRDHSLNMTFRKLSPELASDPHISDAMVPQRPHVLGLIVECRPIEAVPSILELEVSQISFTSTVGMDMKIRSVDTTVADIMGYDPKDLIGSTLKDYFHPSDLAQLIPCKMLLQRTGYACTPMFRFITASGDWAWVQLEGTMRFDERSRKPKHLETIIKIVSQSKGTLKYIEQKEFYSHGKTDNPIVSLHSDPYDTHFPEKSVPQSPKPIMAGLQDAGATKSAIDAVLHGRELALSALPNLLSNVVSSPEEAERLEDKNRELLSTIDFSKFKEGEKIHPVCIMHMLKELEEEEEELAPSSAPSLMSQASSVPSFMTPASVSGDSQMTSPQSVPPSGPHSIPGLVPSPQSNSGLAPSPQSSLGFVPSPHSVASLVPSPGSVASGMAPSPSSVMTYTGFESAASPDSGIDSPTSAGSDSSSSSFRPHSQTTSTAAPMPPASQTFLPAPSHQFQPNVPSAFNFTTQQQLEPRQHFQTPPMSVAGSAGDQTLEMLLTNLSTPQQQQQHFQQQHFQQQQQQQQREASDQALEILPPNLFTQQQQQQFQQQQQQQFQQQQQHPPPPPPPSQEWMERQRQLEDKIQTQKQLLQDLLVQQELLQTQLPGKQQQVLPGQQLVYNRTQNSSSVGPMSAPTDQTMQNFGGFQPLPPHTVVTNGGQNRLHHATSATGNISFLGSVDLLASGFPPPPPSPDNILELFQQLQ